MTSLVVRYKKRTYATFYNQSSSYYKFAGDYLSKVARRQRGEFVIPRPRKLEMETGEIKRAERKIDTAEQFERLMEEMAVKSFTADRLRMYIEWLRLERSRLCRDWMLGFFDQFEAEAERRLREFVSETARVRLKPPDVRLSK